MPAATRASSAARASACTAAAAGSVVSRPRACSAGAADTGPVAGRGASLIRALAAPARTAPGPRAAPAARRGPDGGGNRASAAAGHPARARRCEPTRRAVQCRPVQCRPAGRPVQGRPAQGLQAPGRPRIRVAGRAPDRGRPADPAPWRGHGRDGCGDACPEYWKPPEPPRRQACGNERACGCGRTALAACTVLLLCCPDGQRMPSPHATSRDAPNGRERRARARV